MSDDVDVLIQSGFTEEEAEALRDVYLRSPFAQVWDMEEFAMAMRRLCDAPAHRLTAETLEVILQCVENTEED